MAIGFTIWLTGYSGAGKSTISLHLRERLSEMNIPCETLDGDIVRQNLSSDLGYSKEDRCTNIMRLGFVAELLSRNGICVIVSAISPYRSARDGVRKKIKNFIEVYVKCPIEECERRDVKGLYKKAKNLELNNFTGISDPYEEPINPEITCHTEIEKIEDSVKKILLCLESFNLVPSSVNQL